MSRARPARQEPAGTTNGGRSTALRGDRAVIRWGDPSEADDLMDASTYEGSLS